MRKPKAKTAKPKATDDLALRRWCIEQAINWKWDPARYGQALGGIPAHQYVASEPDIMNRAARILAWVRSSA